MHLFIPQGRPISDLTLINAKPKEDLESFTLSDWDASEELFKYLQTRQDEIRYFDLTLIEPLSVQMMELLLK